MRKVEKIFATVLMVNLLTMKTPLFLTIERLKLGTY